MKKFIGIIFDLLPDGLAGFCRLQDHAETDNAGHGPGSTVYSKGVRERRETKMIMDADPETAAMMEKMMPNVTYVSQCDLKQDVSVNDAKKLYFVDPYDWSSLTPEQKIRRPAEKVTIKGTITVSSIVTDSGKRQQMFGMTAKWLARSVDGIVRRQLRGPFGYCGWKPKAGTSISFLSRTAAKLRVSKAQPTQAAAVRK